MNFTHNPDGYVNINGLVIHLDMFHRLTGYQITDIDPQAVALQYVPGGVFAVRRADGTVNHYSPPQWAAGDEYIANVLQYVRQAKTIAQRKTIKTVQKRISKQWLQIRILPNTPQI